MVRAAVRGDVARSAPAAVLNEGGAIEGRIGIRRADVTSNASGCSITARICGNARYAAFKLGSGLIDYNQKMTMAAMQIADMNV